MNLRIAITDGDWHSYLAGQPDLDEVNFWQPGGSRQFRALVAGEPMLFKLHSPRNLIVGGGFFATSSILPVSLAWETFGYRNGAKSFEEMRGRIEKYRRQRSVSHEDYKIGCIILYAPFFLDPEEWLPVPASFAKSIQQGKNYDMASGEGRSLWADVHACLQAWHGKRAVAEASGQLDMFDDRDEMFGAPGLIRPRLGQGSFRIRVTDTYQRRCAITGEKALPVLDAAHIRPVADGGRHQIRNGILLRSDVHRLYDRGYVTVTPDYGIRVSQRLKDEFDNGEPYYPLQGKKIWLPRRLEERPDRECLEWHSSEVFR